MNKFLLMFFVILLCPATLSSELVRDEFVDEWFKDKNIEIIQPKQKYNYESIKRTKIILSPTEKVSTPKNVSDGQKIELQVKRNARIGKDLLKRGTKGSAIVEIYTTNGMSGIPGTITLGRINIDGIDTEHLRYYYVKKGQDRTLWILPLKWALTFIPFVGSFTNLIKGGQAIISPADDITVYYYE